MGRKNESDKASFLGLRLFALGAEFLLLCPILIKRLISFALLHQRL